MIEFKTNPEECSCTVNIEGELNEIVNDIVGFNNTMLTFFENTEPDFVEDFSTLMLGFYLEYLDGNIEPTRIETQECIHIDGKAMDTFQKVLEAQKGDVA